MRKNDVIYMRISEELKTKLQDVAKEKDLSMSSVITHAVEDFLKRIEKRERK